MRNILLRSRPVSPQFTYQVTVTAAQSTTPKFTLVAGAPAALVSWGDGSAYEAVTSTVELTHTYTNTGIYTVQLLMPNQEKWLTQININTDKVSKVITQIGAFSRLTLFYAYVNAAWSQNISGWVLPASLVDFQFNVTSVSGNISGWVLPASLTNFIGYATSVSGDISGWVLPSSLIAFYVSSTSVSGNISGWVLPAPLTYFYVNVTSLSGDISGWVLPAPLTNFQINATSVSGTPIFTSAVGLSSFLYQNCALLQATIDTIVQRIYNRRMSFTYATPSANVGGTNAAPSGAYADEDPPVTGKGYIYELVNDPETEGFKKWTITYTA
jgi:PKD repeat protein